MQKIVNSLLAGVFIIIAAMNVAAAENEFRKNNPDGGKYEFSRSYISALSYFRVVEKRWNDSPPKKRFPKDDLKVIGGNIEYMVLDNADLRIAKNYMIKYLDSSNSLIRKVADTMIVACDKDIAINNKAKNLWQEWLNIKTKQKTTSKDEKEFIKFQEDLEVQRKESDKSIIKASILLTKVVLSQNNSSDKGKLLAITEKQRNKLLDNLDVYGKDVMDWGLKPGQSTLNASIAVIREVLEDPMFIAQK